MHFHPRELDQAPILTIEYFTDTKGVLRSFKPATQSQGAKGAGVEAKAVGVDPRKKDEVEHKANNATTSERTSLGKQTCLVDGNTGEGRFKVQETGQVVPSFERSEGFHEEPHQEPAQAAAEGKFRKAEQRQVEAEAVTIAASPRCAPRRTSKSRMWAASSPASTTAIRCATASVRAVMPASSSSRKTL